MNIFCTSKSPILSAKYLDDKRIVKMCTESGQILATALHCKGVSGLPIKPTHESMDVVKWASISRQNYKWLLRHFVALLHEKRKRYPNNPPHKYEKHIKLFREHADKLPRFMLTPFVNYTVNKSLGLDFRHITDVHTAYQTYLNERWDTDKRTPTWYGEK